MKIFHRLFLKFSLEIIDSKGKILDEYMSIVDEIPNIAVKLPEAAMQLNRPQQLW